MITGRVVDDRGSPIAGVRVSAQAVLAGNRPGTVRQSGLLPTTTDDTGSFRLFGLPEGDYLVHAQPMVAGHMTMVFPTGESVTRYGRRYAAAYYPGSDTPSHAIPIRVAAGDTYGPIEVPLTDARVFTVRGILLDPSGQPGSSTPVFLRRAGTARATPGFEWPIARPVMDDGTFEFTGISPGDYVVSVNRFRGEVREFGLASVPVYGDVDGVTIRVQSGAMVTGQVFFDGPVPPSLGGLQVRSVPSGAMVLDAISVEPNAEGRFLLPHQYGPTLVRIDGLRGWHLKAVVYGGQDITDTPVEWLERGPALQVFLTDRAATVSGIVRTARGSAVDAAVLLISDDPARFHEHSTTTSLTLAGGDGAFRIEGVRAGRYFAIAVGQDEAPLAGLTREYFDLLARYATAVVVHDGQHTTLDLVLRQLR